MFVEIINVVNGSKSSMFIDGYCSINICEIITSFFSILISNLRTFFSHAMFFSPRKKAPQAITSNTNKRSAQALKATGVCESAQSSWQHSRQQL